MKKINRILVPVLTACVFPILYFLPILNVFISSSISSNSDGTNANLLTSVLQLPQYMSINYLINFFKDESHVKLFRSLIESFSNSEKELNIKEIIPSFNWIYVALVFFALLVVAILAVVLVGIIVPAVGAANKKKLGRGRLLSTEGERKFEITSIVLTVFGLVSAFAMNFSFNKFAQPFIEGKVNLSSFSSLITDSETLGSLGTISSLINAFLKISVDAMELSSAYTFAIIALVAILIIEVAGAFSKD